MEAEKDGISGCVGKLLSFLSFFSRSLEVQGVSGSRLRDEVEVVGNLELVGVAELIRVAVVSTAEVEVLENSVAERAVELAGVVAAEVVLAAEIEAVEHSLAQ